MKEIDVPILQSVDNDNQENNANIPNLDDKLPAKTEPPKQNQNLIVKKN